MPLIECPDCNNEISDVAPACPNCGRPNREIADNKICRYCDSNQVGKVRGLQGINEFLIFVILFCCGILPAIIYYIYIESVPYCSDCGRRI